MKIWRIIGPGLVSGAADDDPSAIGTYSIAGARLGVSLLWTAWMTWPMIAAIQIICARIGVVSGQGVAAVLRERLPRWVVIGMSFALFFANTFNIGADLAAISDAAHLVTGVRPHFFVVVFSLGIAWASIRLKYAQVEKALKWLTLTLLAYIGCSFYAKPVWPEILAATFVPSIPHTRDQWVTFVAVLGTTISPYIFFWQAAEEAEEKSKRSVRERNADVIVGTMFTNVIMYFILLTTALTLHRAGITELSSSADVARALEPLVGSSAKFLYALGLIGAGLLSIPVLAASGAYALAETFGWREGLDAEWRRAKPFYLVILVSILLAVIFDFSGINPIRALFLSSLINGALDPFLLCGIVYAASSPRIMKGQPSGWVSLGVVGLTALMMFGALAAIF